ncbi:MAG: HPP family protein [Arcobacter sp.]|jgi:CBS-domain-containing membrane protein|uniref:CBS domain-containing protein n=1 Tax=Arcobacter defluvii TaxID=873191 RepID=A0AAE7BCW6_9BACT|nr:MULTISPECIES: CBS domain-containing protein [Arcobacter]MDY3199823.1 CBS domain-containing protein [Arcobacter sp.]QKF76813.1 CBS domain-containing protein [Arcobacter defluvii]RXI33848.1 CBS domain-containing protein [Arcobacter defluvii]BAK72632.1 conserved hypothetical protein [Arcobacter sp. L]
MFAIYNNGRVGFRSTVDNLYNLKNVDELDKTRFKPDEGLIQSFSNEEKEEQKKEFLNSYKKMANIDTLEPVYYIKDIMTRDVFSLDNKATIEDAYNFLKDNKITQAPIIDFGKKIIGMINKKIILNLLMEDIENIKSILNKKIEDIYLPEVITSEPLSEVRTVVKVMLDFKLEAIPIVDEDGILLGIVSQTNILKAVAHLPKLQLWS